MLDEVGQDWPDKDRFPGDTFRNLDSDRARNVSPVCLMLDTYEQLFTAMNGNSIELVFVGTISLRPTQYLRLQGTAEKPSQL